MNSNVLIVSAMAGAENCARSIGEQLGVEVQVAASSKAALLALRRSSFSVLVVEESIVENDGQAANQMWEQAGTAIPIQVNFAIAGGSRLGREIRAALLRKTEEHASARRQVTAELENELKSSVTGLLLESELALQEKGVPPALQPKLRHLVELAGALRERLRAGSYGERPS